MKKLKYKIGQEVKIKSLDWYSDNHDEYGDIDLGVTYFREYMSEYCGMTVTISEYNDFGVGYHICEDGGEYLWTDDMIESEVEKDEKLPTEPRKNFITADSRTAKDVDLVEDIFSKGYRLTHIVPRFYNDGSPLGYTYWFESLDLIK